MYNFNFYMPTKVLFGPGRLNDLHSETLPGKKALIAIGGQSVKKFGYLDRLEQQLDMAGVQHVLFEGIRPNPTRQNVMDGAKAVRENGCDFVIALGGGSIMDCTKCIALMASNNGDIWDYSLSGTGGKRLLQIRQFLSSALLPARELQAKWILLPLSLMMTQTKRPEFSFRQCSRLFQSLTATL